MLKTYEQFVNEDYSKLELMDDLKANFRSWEYDHDNEDDAEGLYHILMQRHPESNSDWVREIAYHWVGFEPLVQEDEAEV